MSKLPADRKNRASPRGLQHLETLQPHVHGSDWRKKPEYTAWRFAWHVPLFGGRLPTPAWLAARLADTYRFFAPPILFCMAVLIGVYLYKGWTLPVGLWVAVSPIVFEMPRYLRRLCSLGRRIGGVFRVLIAIPRALGFIAIMLFIWFEWRKSPR